MLIDITPTKLGGAGKADTTSAHRLAGEKEHKDENVGFSCPRSANATRLLALLCFGG